MLLLHYINLFLCNFITLFCLQRMLYSFENSHRSLVKFNLILYKLLNFKPNMSEIPAEISMKIKQLKELKKKDRSKESSFKDKLDKKYIFKKAPKKVKSIFEYTEYDDVLEDSDNIKERRDLIFEKNLLTWIDKKRDLIKTAKINNELYKIPQINTLFPYEEMRNSQKDLIQDIYSSVNSQKHILTNAPTGLGKTVASLGPALEYAIRSKKIVFFLTSRQTQHTMAVRTLKDIQKKYDIEINCLDIIGKRWMCLQEGIENINGGDFSEYCKTAKKERTCEYYNNTKKSNNMVKLEAEIFIDELKSNILSSDEFFKSCKSRRLCPYETALIRGQTAQVIISDYSYVFHPNIKDTLFNKLGIVFEDCIIIVDEAHNLPERTKDSASSVLTTSLLQRALKEAQKYELEEAKTIIRNLWDKILEYKFTISKDSFNANDAVIITKEKVNEMIESTLAIEPTCAVLDKAIDKVRENQKRSFISAILNFIVCWQGQDNGFVRTFSKDENKVDGKVIKYSCLDPSIVTKKVFDSCSSSIVISGTLNPTFMYRDLLGIGECIEKMYPNPFPKENALEIIVPKTTTKFDRRNSEEYKNIANECIKILNLVNGNTAIFFSSYEIRNNIYKYLYDLDETFILEEPNLNKEDKENILKQFMTSSLKRKVLLGAGSGSFGEGIDFPGHFLTCVIVVGLPLMKPTLEINKLIEYYNLKFKKGWDYGYFHPSFNKTFQNVGRCIRSSKDRGILIYLDERFAESRYLKFFESRNYIIEKNYENIIKEFERG